MRSREWAGYVVGLWRGRRIDDVTRLRILAILRELPRKRIEEDLSNCGSGDSFVTEFSGITILTADDGWEFHFVVADV